MVFIDDVLVYLRSQEEHEKHLRMTMQLLRDNQLYVNLKKCDFWLEQVGYLDIIISKDELVVDSPKIEAVVN